MTVACFGMGRDPSQSPDLGPENTIAASAMLRILFSEHGKLALRRAAQAGSLYAVLWLAVGGWAEHPGRLPTVTLRLLYTVTLTVTEYIARGWKPLFDEWTLGFEIARNVSRAFMTHYGNCIGLAPNAKLLRTQTAVVGTLFGAVVCRIKGTTTKTLLVNGLEHVYVRSATQCAAPARRIVALYFHGGGFAVNSPRMYIPFGSELQHRLVSNLREHIGQDTEIAVDVLLANYRKLPEHAHPVPVLDAVAIYNHLVNDEKVPPENIVVMGDSAGAGLAIALMLRLRDTQSEALPLAGVLVCPFVDLEIGGDERKVPYCILADKPCQSIQQLYHARDGHPTTWGDASPVHCDLRGLPPVYIQAAELDYILPHSTRLMAKAEADGLTHWTMEVFANVPHVFTTFPPSILPPAAKGLDAITKFAATHLAKRHS